MVAREPAQPFAYHHGYSGGTTDWLMHTVVSTFAHAMIYGVVFRLLHHLTLMQGMMLLVVALGVTFMWARSRGWRGW